MDTVYLVTRNGLGQVRPEDADFGLDLMTNFLTTLLGARELPRALAFYTEGVRLLCEGSPCLPALGALADRGVLLVACRSCLVRYGLTDRIVVGEIGTMREIVDLMGTSAKVVTV